MDNVELVIVYDLDLFAIVGWVLKLITCLANLIMYDMESWSNGE